MACVFKRTCILSVWSPDINSLITSVIFMALYCGNYKLSIQILFIVIVMCLSIDFDECASDPCLHDGTCNNNFARFDCDCTADWIGVTCQSKYGINHVSHGRPRKIKNNFLAI